MKIVIFIITVFFSFGSGHFCRAQNVDNDSSSIHVNSAANLHLKSPVVFANGSGRGGGDPWKVDEAGLTYLLESGALKNAILKYILSLSENIAKVQDSHIKEIFTVLLDGNGLQSDVSAQDNYKIQAGCEHGLGEKVPTSTRFGDLGGPICFDVAKLASAYRGLSREDAIIALATLAIHNHVHHFQVPPQTDQETEADEQEAYQVAAYVGLTAKVLEVPILKWVEPTETADQFAPYRRIFDQAKPLDLSKKMKFALYNIAEPIPTLGANSVSGVPTFSFIQIDTTTTVPQGLMQAWQTPSEKCRKTRNYLDCDFSQNFFTHSLPIALDDTGETRSVIPTAEYRFTYRQNGDLIIVQFESKAPTDTKWTEVYYEIADITRDRLKNVPGN